MSERSRSLARSEDLVFATKPQIALTQLRQAVESGIPAGVVLADAGYGDETAFRDGSTKLGLLYAVGVRSGTSVRAPGVTPLPPKPWGGRGKPAQLLRRGPGHEPVSVKALAMGLPDDAYQNVTWREGSNAALQSRFAAVRVRPAHRDYWSSEQRPDLASKRRTAEKLDNLLNGGGYGRKRGTESSLHG